MNTEQAMQVLKQLLNVAIQKGLFANVDAVNQVTLALKTVADSISTPKIVTNGRVLQTENNG